MRPVRGGLAARQVQRALMRLRVLPDSYVISSCASPLKSRQITRDMHRRPGTRMRPGERASQIRELTFLMSFNTAALAGPALAQHACEEVLNRAHGHHAVVWNVIQFIQFDFHTRCFERRLE